MFGRLFLGELKKLFKVKTVIIFTAFIIVLLFIALIAYGTDIFPELDAKKYNESELKNELMNLKLTLQIANSAGSMVANEEKQLIKNKILVLEYIKENELYDQSLHLNGEDEQLFSRTAETATSTIMEILIVAVVIYGLVLGASAIASEIKDGTMKLVLLRPLTRNQLVGAKLLATVTYVVAVHMCVFILCLILSHIVYEKDQTKTLYLFNSSVVYLAPRSALIGISYFVTLLSLLSKTVLAFSIGTITRNRIIGIAVPLLEPILASMLSILNTTVRNLSFSVVIQWFDFFTVINTNNFYVSFPMLILYIGGLILGAFIVFKKRDIS
ncbi:MAG: ABC transporter permease [Christensenellaceae bacterium]|jgi:ABC-2 type transport system permease protein|nr:ABC transporter permease [Christensenellaceae bacterium]